MENSADFQLLLASRYPLIAVEERDEELEAAVVSAMYRAFAAGAELSTEVVAAELSATAPISRTGATSVRSANGPMGERSGGEGRPVRRGSVVTRMRVHANRPWVKVMGYSRAVRVGNVIEVGGTAAADPDGNILAPGDLAGQTRAALQTIGDALRELGASFGDVVRTRIYLRDPSQWEEAARVHGEFFREILPANTTVGATFIDPEMLVEVEATAILDAP